MLYLETSCNIGSKLIKVGGILVFLQGVNPQRWWGKNLHWGKTSMNKHNEYSSNSMNFIMLPVQISPLQSHLPITKTDDFDKGCQTLGLISPVLRAWSSSSLRYL